MYQSAASSLLQTLHQRTVVISIHMIHLRPNCQARRPRHIRTFMANCACVPAFVTSTARSTSPNWHSFKESIALQLRPVACDTSVKHPSSCTRRAAVNLGGGKLSGPPLAAMLVMAEEAIMGVAAAELLRSVAMRWLSLW